MGALKAPGSEGIILLFFQKCWDIVSESIPSFVRTSFVQGEFDRSLNQSSISLIPKVEFPSTMAQFRPIALCNILARVAAKVVANKLKNLMPILTSENQRSFILRKQAADHIV